MLGNLTSVTQGSQTRTFVYDSLSRLRSATNPESGTVSYSYDDNGNLLTKVDARGVVSTYTYYALNRNTSVDYPNDPANAPPSRALTMAPGASHTQWNALTIWPVT